MTPRPAASPRPLVEELESRLAPATFAWTGQAGDFLFSDAANWSNAATGATGTPGAGDRLVFPLNGPGGPRLVNNDLAANTALNSITFLSNGWTIAGNTIGLTAGIQDAPNTNGTNVISANLTFAAAAGSVPVTVATPATLSLTGTVDLAAAGMTFAGPGSLTVSGVVSNSTGSGGIVANSTGTLSLSAANTYTGPTTINSGLVTVTNANGLGTGAVTVNSGGSLTDSASGIANALTLNGNGFGGDGALRVLGTVSYLGPVTLQSTSSILVTGALTLAGPAATTGSLGGGASGLTLEGRGTVVMQDTATYTGVTTVLGTTLTLSSPAAGQAGGTMTTSGYVVALGGTLKVDNTTQQTNNRLGTAAFVELDGTTLSVLGAAAVDTENFAALNLGNAAPGVIGADIVTLNATTNTTMTVGTLNRFPGSTVAFQGTNLGTATDQITFTSFAAGAGLVNGVLPYATFGTTDFATQGANGIAASNNTSATGNISGFTGVENLKLTGNVTLTGDVFVNSLNLNGFNVALGTFRLIIGSGGLLQSATPGSAISGGGQLVFGTTTLPAAAPFPANAALTPVEGIITRTVGNLTLSAPVAVANNLTLNISPLATAGGLAIADSANSTYTGVTWLTTGILNLTSTTAAAVIPAGGTLVVGDNGFTPPLRTANLVIPNNFQQIGTGAAPGNLVGNDGVNISLGGVVTQIIGNLTLRSVYSGSSVFFTAATVALTVTGGITSGASVLSPATPVSATGPLFVTGFVGGTIDPTVPPLGTLIFAPASGTATIFNVADTPAATDLTLAAPISGSAILDKQGAGTLSISATPAAYTGTIQVDGGTFLSGVAGLTAPVVVNAGGKLGTQFSGTTNTVTLNGGVVDPGSSAAATNAVGNANGSSTNNAASNFSNGGVLNLHINGYGTAGTDYDQFQGSTGAAAVTLGGTSLLTLDLNGLAQSGALTLKATAVAGASPFIWANPLNGFFSDAPNGTGPNILPAADVINNPFGFQAIVTYGRGFITLALTHPPVVANSSFSDTQGATLTVTTRATGALANVTDPDFVGAASEALLATVVNPGTITGSAGGSLIIKADGTFTYTPLPTFLGAETFTLRAVDTLGGTSAPFTVTMTVAPGAPTSFTGLTNATIVVGTAVGLTGTVTAVGGGIPTGTVTVTINGVNQTATLAANGSFSVAFPTANLPVSGSPYTVTYSYPAAVGFAPITDATHTLTVVASLTPVPPVVPPTTINWFVAGSGPGISPEVKVWKADGTLLFDFQPFSPAFTGGVTVALGDVNGDGVPDIIVGAGRGGGPEVRVIDGSLVKLPTNPLVNDVNADTVPGAVIASFYAYDPLFSGGVYVAAGRLDGTGKYDVITGAGVGGGPEVKVWAISPAGVVLANSPLNDFFAFDPAFRGGVTVSAGDLEGLNNGTDDLVVGVASNGSPQVRVYRPNSQLIANFFAAFGGTGGVNVAAGDVEGKGFAQLILGAGAGSGSPRVVVEQVDQTQLDSFFAFPSGFGGGVTVGASTAVSLPAGTGDLLVTGAGVGGAPLIRSLNRVTQTDLFGGGLFAFDQTNRGGASV